jgi:hypothetical protein
MREQLRRRVIASCLILLPFVKRLFFDALLRLSGTCTNTITNGSCQGIGEKTGIFAGIAGGSYSCLRLGAFVQRHTLVAGLLLVSLGGTRGLQKHFRLVRVFT